MLELGNVQGFFLEQFHQPPADPIGIPGERKNKEPTRTPEDLETKKVQNKGDEQIEQGEPKRADLIPKMRLEERAGHRIALEVVDYQGNDCRKPAQPEGHAIQDVVDFGQQHPISEPLSFGRHDGPSDPKLFLLLKAK